MLSAVEASWDFQYGNSVVYQEVATQLSVCFQKSSVSLTLLRTRGILVARRVQSLFSVFKQLSDIYFS